MFKSPMSMIGPMSILGQKRDSKNSVEFLENQPYLINRPSVASLDGSVQYIGMLPTIPSQSILENNNSINNHSRINS